MNREQLVTEAIRTGYAYGGTQIVDVSVMICPEDMPDSYDELVKLVQSDPAVAQEIARGRLAGICDYHGIPFHPSLADPYGPPVVEVSDDSVRIVQWFYPC